MSKKKKIIIISVVCAALIIGAVTAFLLLGGDEDDTYKAFDENEQYMFEKNGAKEYSSPVLVVYGEDDQLVGVTQLGNKVYLDNPDNINIKQGCVATTIEIKVDDDGVRRGNLCYPYSTNTNLPVYGSQDNAPRMMIDMRLKSLMNTPGYASITDYKINSVTVGKVDSAETGTAVVNFKVNIDVHPSKFGDIYGDPDSEGWCKGLEYDYAIWGTEGIWYQIGDDPIVERTGNYSNGSMRIIEETTLFVNDDHMINYACFESPEQSILTDAPINRGEPDESVDVDENELEEDAEVVTYYTQLFSMNSDGTIDIIEQGMRNLQYAFITDCNNKIYLTSSVWNSDSEVMPSHLICYDLNTKRITRIMDRCALLGITDDTIYAYGSNMINGVYRPQDIYAVDMATGTIKWVTEPVMIADETNTFIEQGVYDGYLHVMYASDKLVFKLDEQTGEWSFHYAG